MQEKDYITYEYKTKVVKRNEQTRAIDIYEAFGWEITSVQSTVTGGVALSMRRDRKLKHKQEMVKLERQAEEKVGRITALEKSKTLSASVFGYVFGVIATLILGGGMSLLMVAQGNVGALIGGIVLGVIGIVLMSVNYPIFKKIAEKKTKEVLPLIDENEEQLANVLEKGNDLLSTDLL